MLLFFASKSDFAKYFLMPQVGPRIKEFMLAGFGNLALFMALVFKTVNLLPQNHPYATKASIGSFTVRDVLSEANRNLVYNRQNIDKIIIFFAIVTGIILLALQFALLLMAILINPARAQTPSNIGSFFTTPNPEEDLALRLLDSVFGVEGLYNSQEIAGGSSAFHEALQGLFSFYSIGLLVIAALIIAYYIFAVVAETAQTGTPFGKRYNHVWAPIRLVVAIGLLIPIGSGFNSAQWIGLYAAKFGSGFATNGWIEFNETMRGTYINPEELIGQVNVPDLKNLSAFMMMAHACKYAYEKDENKNREIKAWIPDPDKIKAPIELPLNDLEAIDFVDGRNIEVVFGEYNPVEHDKQPSKIFPYCGKLVITNTQPAKERDTNDIASGSRDASIKEITEGRYYTLVRNMWEVFGGEYPKIVPTAEIFINRSNNLTPITPTPSETEKNQIISEAEDHIREGIAISIRKLAAKFQAEQDYKKYGWGGAGIWYNKIADVNGQLVTALVGKPQIKSLPTIMEYVCEENKQQNKNVAPKDCYNPRLSKGTAVQHASPYEIQVAAALGEVFSYWYEAEEDKTNNAFIDTINLIFGTQGLFDMCANANTHPLAQLATTGKGLVDASIRNFGGAAVFGVGSIVGGAFGPALGAVSSFASSIASIGILIGFILFYIVPFMPFLYFFFAVGGWVKGLFEAMVGLPLWALAHIRIDGQGLPGDGALNGYFLIFEIFIRPILIVFGLLASILIFGAMVKVLNETFSLAVSNLSGFDNSSVNTCGGGSSNSVGQTAKTGSLEYLRGPVDEFFFTIVYAILVYMIGMASFKLIDMIPNQILRWMGAGVSTFGDQAGEPAEGLLQKVAVGGSLIGGQIGGVVSSAGQAASGFGGGIASKLFNRGAGN
jgi:conjugal transfer/type IV secretion protein DotA/TraY